MSSSTGGFLTNYGRCSSLTELHIPVKVREVPYMTGTCAGSATFELNKKIGLRGNYKAHTPHGVMLFSSFTAVYVLRGLLSRANDFH